MGMEQPRGWQELLKDDVNRWNEPNQHVVSELSDWLNERRKPLDVLDIGYGAGRHILYFARRGDNVSGFEVAPNGEEYTRQRLAKAGLNPSGVNLRTFDMHERPWQYLDDSFDLAVAINVIHHTGEHGLKGLEGTMSEIYRVLRPGGQFLATLASRENHKFGKGKQIDSHTYLTPDGAEAGIPHTFLGFQDVVALLPEDRWRHLKIQAIAGEIPDADKALKKPGALDHLLVYAEKRPVVTASVSAPYSS